MQFKQFNHFPGISSQLVSSAKVLPECITNYAAYLKEKYKELAVLPDSEWPPTVGEKFIRLALIKQDRLPDPQSVKEIEDDYIRGKVDKILNYKEEIGLTEMFELSPDQQMFLRFSLMVHQVLEKLPSVAKSAKTGLMRNYFTITT